MLRDGYIVQRPHTITIVLDKTAVL